MLAAILEKLEILAGLVMLEIPAVLVMLAEILGRVCPQHLLLLPRFIFKLCHGGWQVSATPVLENLIKGTHTYIQTTHTWYILTHERILVI